MKSIETTSFGVKFRVAGVPETFGELLELGGKAGLTEQQLLDKVNGFFIAHNVNEDGRDVIREVGPDGLDVLFKTEEVKKKNSEGVEETVTQDAETLGTWAKRAAAAQGTDAAGLALLLQPLVDKAKDDKGADLKDLEFTVGGARKGGAGNKVGKEVLAQAKATIEAGTSATVVDLLTKRHPDLVFVYDDKGVVTAESLATAIRTNKLRREQEDAKLLGLTPVTKAPAVATPAPTADESNEVAGDQVAPTLAS